MTIYEILTVLIIVCMCILAGVHISFGKYLEAHGKPFPKIRLVLTFGILFTFIFLLRHAVRGLEETSNVHFIFLPLGALAVFAAYKINRKRLEKS